MAASDNLMTMEMQPWAFRPTFADAWFSDMIFTKETDTLTKALQKSLAATSSDGGDAFSPEMFESLLTEPETAPLQTPTNSGASENNEAVVVSRPRRGVPPPSGRVAKRKSRASKRATTTFITADPANFRQMVQQVTGVRLAGLSEQLPAASPVLKPEPHRIMSRAQSCGGLSTFDTSAFFLDGSASSLLAQPLAPAVAVADGGATATGLEFDSFCSFPTLESWEVM